MQVEFVLGNEDENGVAHLWLRGGCRFQVRGSAWEESPGDPDDDPDWVQFRADYVTRYLVEARDAVKAVKPDAVFQQP